MSLVAALAIFSSCAAPPAPPSMSPPLDEPSSAVAAGPVVVVTIDGVRWQEVFDGTDPELSQAPARPSAEIIPNLDGLAREGGVAVGAPGRGVIRATGPNFVSLPGYTELLTGRAPIDCQDNACPAVTSPTFLDEVHASGLTAAGFGSWEMLDRALSSRPGTFAVNCGRSGDPAIDPWPGSGDFRPDRLTAELALHYLESERPDALYVGLGEPDEYGHRGDYAGYVRALSAADAFVGELMATLRRMGPRGAATHLFVTADHGRARDFRSHGGAAPESARVWLVASGPSIHARGRVASSDERHLADVAPTLRRVLGLAPAPDGDDRGWRGQPMHELFGDEAP